MRKLFLLCLLVATTLNAGAQVHVAISNPDQWAATELSKYIGQTVTFDDPMIICSFSNSGTTVSPRRIFAPTNQALPRTKDYDHIIKLNNTGSIKLTGLGSNLRTGQHIEQLTIQVTGSGTGKYISGTIVGNSRADLTKGPDMSAIDMRGEHTLLVCAMNLEYYLAHNFSGNGMGPANAEQHARQRTKTIAALSTINADIYGLVEIQKGDEALREIAAELNKALPARGYRIVKSGTASEGSFTQSCYIYDTTTVETVGQLITIDEVVKDRKRMQIFREKATGEEFNFSINHFKAKSGSGSGVNANQGDGQGGFNADRVKESKAVIDRYNTYVSQIKAAKGEEDLDILIMGDLNAYGKEDPITTLIQNGMTDLHRSFHADSSYSYTFGGQAGYLDHALCSRSLLPQVTGMVAFHINSDEDDRYTYDKSNDLTMFRSSDHDPVLVGLRLDRSAQFTGIKANTLDILRNGDDIVVCDANVIDRDAYYLIVTPSGTLVQSGSIDSNEYTIARPTTPGLYILMVYANGVTKQVKLLVR